MKKYWIITACVCFVANMISQNGAAIEFKMSSSKGVKGSFRISSSSLGTISEFSMYVPKMPGGGTSGKSLVRIADPDLIYMISDKDKSYSELKKPAGGEDDQKNYTVSKMGEEKINGYNCTRAMITDGTDSYEVWNTKDIADFEKYNAAIRNNKRMSSEKRQEALRNADCEGFPVRTIHRSADGDMTVELVKLEKKTFTKSDFEIPAGYTKSQAGSAPGSAR
jgi:hypothetical protein